MSTLSFALMRRPSPYWCSTSVCGATVLNVIAHKQTVTYISEWSAHVFLLMRRNSADTIFLFEERGVGGDRREGHHSQQQVHSPARGHWYPEVLFCLCLFFFLSIFVCMSISVYSWVHLAND